MGYRVAIVGATGNVGREFLELLAERNFPADDVVALASEKSAGRKVSFGDKDTLTVRDLAKFDFKGIDIALFSAGLEPETGEGAPYTVSDGRVAFRTINKLPAGQDIVLQIRAKATEAGTHVFRAEVLCRDLEIKLAAEETTRFYLDDLSHDKQATPPATVGASYEAASR